MKRVAVVLAGGRGERFSSHIPKQFSKLSGRLVIEHTVEIFENSRDIDDIVIVCPEHYTELVWDLVARNNWKKIQKVAVGGADRFGSTESGILTLAQYPDDTLVLFHDAVRPLLSPGVIGSCLEALKSFAAVDVVIPSTDTVVVVDEQNCITNIPVRSSMRRGQTPQGFKLGTIKEAYRCANLRGLRDFTCDCGVVRETLPQVAIATVPGEETNIKITNQLDLFVIEKLMQSASVGPQIEGNASITGKSLVIFGGSSGIGDALATVAKQRGARVWVASRAFNQVDVANPGDVDRFLRDVSASTGSIDFVVNCAGLLVKKPLSSMIAEEIECLIKTNYIGAVNVALGAKPHLAASKGMLVNFTSSSYTRGRAQYAVYSSTKSAVVNLTQALAEEWASENIKVNCISPERTRTPMRTTNFGAEPVETLLDPTVVADRTLQVLNSGYTGMIVDVRRQLGATKSV